MAKIIARNGIVEIGGNAVAEIMSLSIDETMEPIRSDALGDTAHENISGDTSWTGQLECYWDKADSTGQEAMTIGASVTISFLPEGAGTGNYEISGTALVTSRGIANAKQSLVTQSFSVIGSGALTYGTDS